MIAEHNHQSVYSALLYKVGEEVKLRHSYNVNDVWEVMEIVHHSNESKYYVDLMHDASGATRLVTDNCIKRIVRGVKK